MMINIIVQYATLKKRYYNSLFVINRVKKLLNEIGV